MTALAANSRRQQKVDNGGVHKDSRAVRTGQVIYEGSMVAIVTTTGRLTVADNVATVKDCIGIATQKVTGTTGGTVTCEFMTGHIELMNAATAVTSAYIGCDVCAMDDDAVSTGSAAGTAALRCRVGKVLSLPSANKAWVWIGNFAGRYV